MRTKARKTAEYLTPEARKADAKLKVLVVWLPVVKSDIAPPQARDGKS